MKLFVLNIKLGSSDNRGLIYDVCDSFVVRALDENEAVDAATKQLSDLKPEADSDLMVVITIETG